MMFIAHGHFVMYFYVLLYTEHTPHHIVSISWCENIWGDTCIHLILIESHTHTSEEEEKDHSNFLYSAWIACFARIVVTCLNCRNKMFEIYIMPHFHTIFGLLHSNPYSAVFVLLPFFTIFKRQKMKGNISFKLKNCHCLFSFSGSWMSQAQLT